MKEMKYPTKKDYELISDKDLIWLCSNCKDLTYSSYQYDVVHRARLLHSQYVNLSYLCPKCFNKLIKSDDKVEVMFT